MRASHVVLASLLALAAGCNSSSDTAADSGTDSGSGRDAGPVPPGSCAQPGDTGNENGVGLFCTPGGGECRTHPLASICIVDLSPSDGQWYCTRLCTHDSDCGSNAVCGGDSRGMACIPAACAPPADAGTDAGATDAATDDAATMDGSTDDAATMDGSTDDAATSADAAVAD